MKLIRKKYLRKTFLAILAVLAVFLVVSYAIICAHYRSTLYQEFVASKKEELGLLDVVLKDAVADQRHQEIQQLLDTWGRELECVVKLKVAGGDGRLLASYARRTGSRNSLAIEFNSRFSKVIFSLEADTRTLEDDISALQANALTISTLIALVMSLTIIIVTRHLAIAPLSRLLTRRKELLNKMRRISRENSRLVESAGEGIFSLRNDGSCSFVNDTALAMLGYRRSEVLDKNIHELIHYSARNGASCVEEDCQILFAMKTAKGVIVEEDLFWRSDGSSFPVTYSSFPLEESHAHVGVVVVFRDITEQYEKRALLEHQANHDPLTGLVNRREFERRLNRAVETARVEQKEHVLLFMDLDNFKPVNDTAGHNAGDELLRKVASRMSFLVRDRDTLARMGGDEFAILLENCDMSVAMRIASEITDTICGDEFSWESMSFMVGVSVGVAAIDTNSVSADAVLDAADGACYMAKQLGGCQVQIWSPELLGGDNVH